MKEKLAAIACKASTSAAAEISKSISDLSGAGTVWAKAWLIKSILAEILTAVVVIIIIVAIALLIHAFLKKALPQAATLAAAKKYTDEKLADIKARQSKTEEEICKARFTLHDLETTLKNVEFDQIKEKIHQLLSTYDNGLRSFHTRMQRVEKEVFKNKKRDKGTK